MHELIAAHHEISQKLEELERKDIEHDKKILLIFEYLKQLVQGRRRTSSGILDPITLTSHSHFATHMLL